MAFKKLETNHDGLRFLIEEDYPDVGAYLYIYQDEKCTHDFLQNNIEMCKKFAFNEYRVPLISWREI